MSNTNEHVLQAILHLNGTVHSTATTLSCETASRYFFDISYLKTKAQPEPDSL